MPSQSKVKKRHHKISWLMQRCCKIKLSFLILQNIARYLKLSLFNVCVRRRHVGLCSNESITRHVKSWCLTQRKKKATIHQVTTMLSTSKNVLFPGHNHLLTTGNDDLTLSILPKRQRASVPVVSRCLWPGNMTFLKVNSMVVSWSIVTFLPSVKILWNLAKYSNNLRQNVTEVIGNDKMHKKL